MSERKQNEQAMHEYEYNMESPCQVGLWRTECKTNAMREIKNVPAVNGI